MPKKMMKWSEPTAPNICVRSAYAGNKECYARQFLPSSHLVLSRLLSLWSNFSFPTSYWLIKDGLTLKILFACCFKTLTIQRQQAKSCNIWCTYTSSWKNAKSKKKKNEKKIENMALTNGNNFETLVLEMPTIDPWCHIWPYNSQIVSFWLKKPKNFINIILACLTQINQQ